MANSANVAFRRKELEKKAPEYEVVADAVAGSPAVKEKGQTYLPKPNPSDMTPANSARYSAYKTRAVFYGATGRTLRGLSGLIFAREPVVEVPATMQVVIDDTNGEGVSAVQLAKAITADTISFGRAGLFVDYPATAGQVTREQLERDNIRPTIVGYGPLQIINWRTRARGALSVLSLVVLEEDYTISDDGFETKTAKQWRALRLSDTNVYSVEIWRATSANAFIKYHEYIPTNHMGNTLTDIPFCFIGSENNDSSIDPVPLFDLADLNMAHYRNSADHEENLFVAAQATPVLSGLTEQWADKYFKEGVGLGSRAAIPLPAGATAELLQAEAVSALSEEMAHKERQMVALGAKIVEQREVQRTAAEANNEEASETSMLASIAENVSLAFTWALGWAADFIGIPETGIVFTLNSNFDLATLTPAERDQVVKEWQAEAITFEEMRAVLRKTGIATLDDKKAQDEISKANKALNETDPAIDNPL